MEKSSARHRTSFAKCWCVNEPRLTGRPSPFIAAVFFGFFPNGDGLARLPSPRLLCARRVGALYLPTVPFTDAPQPGLAFIIASRLLTGFSESFEITATMACGLSRVGPARLRD
jgi:hypothetical protein